jgi:hypothetical protein
VFLSVVSITSKQLVNYMKNVWKIRGPLESHQLADRRFVLEFALEGDYEHVTRGGPWRYQGDAVLIRKLDDGEDPNSVCFEAIPIWVQFTRIPFYLLSKQLARKLGKKLGEYITIDNNARGDICEKILRARVNLPIARPLQRWITLEDEFSNEEVLVTVLYERLPSFCRCCGVIGHQEDACDLPAALRRRRYSKDIGVPATHVDDPRKWFLPESARDNGRGIHMDLPWRNVAALGPRSIPARAPQLALVAHVAEGVEKLSVQDGLTTGAMATLPVSDKANPSQASQDETEHANDKNKSISKNPPPTKISNDNVGADVSQAGLGAAAAAGLNIVDKANSPRVPTDDSEHTTDKNKTDANVSAPTKTCNIGVNNTHGRRWKRMTKGEEVSAGSDSKGALSNSNSDRALIKLGGTGSKGTLLGKRTGAFLKADAYGTEMMGKKKRTEKGTAGDSEDGDPGSTNTKEATSHGAAGQLTGANASACQEP